MPEQPAQWDISGFIFNVSEPAVNVLMDIGTDQEKNIVIETACALSAMPAWLSKKQQSFYSSFHPHLD